MYLVLTRAFCFVSQKASQKAVEMVHYLVSLKAPQKALKKVSEMA